MFLNVSAKYWYEHKMFLTLNEKIHFFHWKELNIKFKKNRSIKQHVQNYPFYGGKRENTV